MNPLRITAITCTGDRPEAFDLCRQYLLLQTHPPCQWIVLCDGVTVTSGVPENARIEHNPSWRGKHSLAAKTAWVLGAGLIEGDAVAFIEDDDYYAPNYLAVQADRMSHGHDLVGEGNAMYYNVRSRWWSDNKNTQHASLCQTVVRRKLFPLLASLCVDTCPFLDVRLWKPSGINKQMFMPGDRRTTIGIKGMPGRVGYGSGHGPASRYGTPDPQFTMLPKLIGAREAAPYAKYYAP